MKGIVVNKEEISEIDFAAYLAEIIAATTSNNELLALIAEEDDEKSER